ncbi:hypothetical protein Tco_1281915 [Tanacetum coccineum]
MDSDGRHRSTTVCDETYPLAGLKVQKKRRLTPNQRKVLKEKVIEWLKAGMIRRVQYPGWITNVMPIQQKDGSWRVHTNFTILNKVCPKDMYPRPKVEEKLESLMGYWYKCFLRLPKDGIEEIRSYLPKNDEQDVGNRGLKP